MIATIKRKSLFFNTNITNIMTLQQKIYFIICERRLVTVDELIEITLLPKMKILKALAALMLQRKIKSKKTDNGFRYFVIINKRL